MTTGSDHLVLVFPLVAVVCCAFAMGIGIAPDLAIWIGLVLAIGMGWLYHRAVRRSSRRK